LRPASESATSSSSSCSGIRGCHSPVTGRITAPGSETLEHQVRHAPNVNLHRGHLRRAVIASTVGTTAWPQFGGPAGFFLANLAILAFSQMSGDQFLSWGWRVPFWLSLIMVGIGLWIRLGILETPIFRQVIADERVARAPVVEVFKRQPKEVILTGLARMGQMAPAFVYGAFIFTYSTKVVGASRDFLLIALLIGSFMSFFTIPFSGYLSDRLCRKQVYIFGAAATGLFAFAYYALLDTAVPGLIVLAVLVSFAFHDLMWGPLAALTAECFTPRLR
jgi:MFS family permease